MKLIYLSVVSIGLFACSNNSNANDVNEPDVKVQSTLDTENSENDSKESSMENLKIEDYLKFRSRAELEKFFGKENMKDGSSWYAEGTVEMKHSVVTNPENKHKVKYLYDGDNKTVGSIEFTYGIYNEDFTNVSLQKIESTSGLYTGMPVKELAEWNENKEIKFSGFGWDYEGNVFYGKDQLNPNSKLAKSGLRLQMAIKGDQFIEEFTGDITLSTKDKNVLASDIVIGMITVYFENNELQAEDSEGIYYMSMEFEEFFEAFQAAVKNKDIETLKKLSDIGKQTNVQKKEITEDFDEIFGGEVKKKILSTKPSDLKDTKIPNGKQGKELNCYVEYHEDGDTFESSTFFYFQKTDNGWKLVSVIIAG